MRTICLALILTGAAGIRLMNPAKKKAVAHPLRPVEDGMTLRKWIQNQPCLNLASLPLMNTQFAQLGAIDALDSEGLMDKVTGMSGVSSGAFIVSLAASKNRTLASERFRSLWPGWTNLGATIKDPEFSQNYREQILDKVLPQTFEELKIPTALVAVHYFSEAAAAAVDGKKAEAVVISDGDLPEATIVSSSAMIGSGCPKCNFGWQAKNFRGMWPVADGFLLDEYGTLGLQALAPCENLLHIMPQNSPQQLIPTLNENLDTQPKNVVSLGVDVPSSAIMSFMFDGLKKDKVHASEYKFLKHAVKKDKNINEGSTWEKVEYETAYTHMKERLDQPMMVGEEPNHFFVDLNLKEHWKGIRANFEKQWDNMNDGAHRRYWKKTISRRNQMVGERNKAIAERRLSYRPGGNGVGAPQV